MTTVLDPPKVKEALTDGVLLHNSSWATYESLLRDNPVTPSLRLTYDRGDLLIMVASLEHEEISCIIAHLIQLLAEEFEVESRAFGSTTYRLKDLQRGFEPDSCFYFKHEAQMRGKKRLDLTKDPRPDLVVEIDITSPSIRKLPLFAAFGMPEVWRFDGRQVEFRLLENGSYRKGKNSSALPGVTAAAITKFIPEGLQMGHLKWVKKVRAWAQHVKASHKP